MQAASKEVIRVAHDNPRAPELLAGALRELLAGREVEWIVCIGTDRATGDALGPLVGSWLQETSLAPLVVGTLDDPVHATNLESVLADLTRNGGLVLAVDACLGRQENVGTITLWAGPVYPGVGVGKNALPPVGDLSITGTVNVGGFMEHFVLQNTGLAWWCAWPG